MQINEITSADIVLARHIPSDFAWKDGLSFFSDEQDFIQVGTWGYDPQKVLLAHSHNRVSRRVNWTQEVLYIRHGSIKADIYDSNDSFVKSQIGFCLWFCIQLMQKK